MIHPMFDRHAQCERLPLPSYDHDDLARFKNGLYAYRKCHAGHGGNVVVKEARVCEDGIVRESLHTRTRRKRRPWLVDSQMPILTNSSPAKLDTANGLDLCLVPVAFVYQIRRVSIEDVYVFGIDIHYTHNGNVISFCHPDGRMMR